jgi:hypothetical protein
MVVFALPAKRFAFSFLLFLLVNALPLSAHALYALHSQLPIMLAAP